MKCDELKYERLDDAFETYPDSTLVIRKQYVDAAIDELEANERRMKRALYKACANWAKERSLYYYSAVPNRRRCRLWEKVETKCCAMEDKFKETDNGNDKL